MAVTDYKLGINGLDEEIGGIKSGTNLMIIGPPMTGKDVILNNIMYYGLKNDEFTIFISTGESGENVFKWFEENGLDIRDSMGHFGVIDCISKTLGLGVEDTEAIKRVSSPVNLTGISVSITNFFEDFWMKKGIRKARLCIDSLSTMLMYSNLQTVFRFLHVHSRRIKTADAIGIYIIESGMHDEQTIVTVKQLFDGVLEIKNEDDNLYIRATGLTSKPTSWFQYEIDGAEVKIKK